jgi:tRNA threonylcarbamoyl adenosine modification protein (Sua5/YciO/YrdC/YwlC family)
MTMTPDLLPADDETILLAVRALTAGAVVAIPTDTVYGLAVDPNRSAAVDRLFALKERPANVALPVLVGSGEQVALVASPLEGAARHLADRYWPGPLTLVVPRRYGFTVDLGGPPSARQTVGVRWADHPVVQALCREMGPLAVTSANLHGEPPATSAEQVATAFGVAESLTLIVDGGPCRGAPSTVVECRGPASRCLREGAIPWGDLVEPPRGSPPPEGRR